LAEAEVAFKLARLTLIAAFSLVAFHTRAEDIKLRVSIFPDAQNLSLFVAQDLGFFKKRGLDVEIAFTPSSPPLREGLANGNHQIVHAAVDNAVAMIEIAKADAVIVAGGGNGATELMVRPEINSIADLRGKTAVVDAPNTAYALIMYKMLEMKGLKRSEYKVLPAGGCPQRLDAMRKDPANAFSMLYPPCTIFAEKEGYRSLGAGVDVVGPYQAAGIFVMRPWAKANADTLVKYIQAAIEGYRYATDPANKMAAVASLSKHLNIDADTAMKSLVYEIGPKGALAKDARFDMEGFRNTLSIRAEIEGGNAETAPAKYLDMSYYERALSGL
jgi:ABC-type nitrate/sulfonate/bicarbonate transport system substrate-binding protein